MDKISFSVIVSTNRGPIELEPLFRNADKESELIIADSNYNDDTKEFLSNHKDAYKQIIYVPLFDSRFIYSRDYNLGLNTALMYAEEKWVIRADDNLEFKPDFFGKCCEDISRFEKRLGHSKFSIMGQKLWGKIEQEKWNGYSEFERNDRYIEIRSPRSIFSFEVLPLEMAYNLNGYTEMYDKGWGWSGVDFFYRGQRAKYKFYYDRELMAYSEPHEPRIEEFNFNEIIWQLQRLEILCGKTRAFNSYDIRQEQNKLLVVKEDFLVE